METGHDFQVGEFCHHRHEDHLWRLSFDGQSYRCERCGLYVEKRVTDTMKREK